MKQKILSDAQLEEIKAVRKANENKKIEKRLQVLVMHGEGKSQREIQAATGFSRSYVNKIVKTYLEEGISAVGEAHYKGNRRNMSIEEEAALLAPFVAEAEAGQIVEVSKIKAAYVEKVGHEVGSGQIYYVLKRQGWRKVLPRSQRLDKAGEETMEGSEKIGLKSKVWESR